MKTILHKRITRISNFDILWIFLSPIIAVYLRDAGFLVWTSFSKFPPPAYIFIFSSIISGFLTFYVLQLGSKLEHHFSSKDAIVILLGTLVSLVSASYITFLINRLEGLPRTIPFIYGLVLSFGLLGYRLIYRNLHESVISISLKQTKVPLNNIRRIIIVGLDRFAINTIKLLNSQSPQAAQVVAAISPSGKYGGKIISNVKIAATFQEIGSLIDEFLIHGVKINEVWISDNSKFFGEFSLDYIKYESQIRGAEVKFIAEALHLIPNEVINEQEKRNISQFEINKKYFELKRIFDVVISFSILILCSPIIIFIIILTLLDVGLPILFWQERVGFKGETFRLYKFRTLRSPFDSDGYVLEDSYRMSLIGKLTRRFRLDEIPQLINILVGEMSLIGPRPLLAADQPHNAMIRLAIRPGITGWAQVNGGEKLTKDEKNALDCWYITHASFILDLEIIYRTFIFIFLGSSRNEVALFNAINWMKNNL